MSEDQLQNNRPTEPQRQYCMGAGLYHPRGCKFGRWSPFSPVQSRWDRKALGALTFHLQPPGGSSGTNRTRHHRPLPPSPGVGQLGHLRQFASCLCLRRPVYCPGWRWMSFPPGPRWMSFPLARGGPFSTPIKGWLASILTTSRGSSCRGPILG